MTPVAVRAALTGVCWASMSLATATSLLVARRARRIAHAMSEIEIAARQSSFEADLATVDMRDDQYAVGLFTVEGSDSPYPDRSWYWWAGWTCPHHTDSPLPGNTVHHLAGWEPTRLAALSRANYVTHQVHTQLAGGAEDPD